MRPWIGIVVAALGGLAVGVERQRSGHATGAHARFGGVRTFTLLGGLSGVAGWLATEQMLALGIVLAAGAVALVVAGYMAASRHDVDATTETAALVVVAAGLAAGLGWLALASGITAISTLLLVEKSRLHALVRQIDDEELRAAARFGVMAVVVLPLLPEGPIGPLGGIKPRELWLLVLFFTGLSFVGYLARRTFGPGQGYPLAGLLAGVISSTNATFTFARLSRGQPTLSRPLAVGTVAACTVLFPRVMLATLVLNRSVAAALMPYLGAPLAVGLLALALAWRRRSGGDAPETGPSNPLQFRAAIEMAAMFQIVLFAVAWMRRVYGAAGLLTSGAILGLTDVDALTISMSKSAADGTPATIAAQAIAVGILMNCMLKAGLALIYGTGTFRRLAATTLLAMAAATAVGVWK